MGSELYFFSFGGGGGSFLRKGVQEKVTPKGIQNFFKSPISKKMKMRRQFRRSGMKLEVCFMQQLLNQSTGSCKLCFQIPYIKGIELKNSTYPKAQFLAPHLISFKHHFPQNEGNFAKLPSGINSEYKLLLNLCKEWGEVEMIWVLYCCLINKTILHIFLQHLSSFTLKTAQEAQVPAKERLRQTKVQFTSNFCL